MNPIVRHFLPSVVRGVYRADEEFPQIGDDSGFKRFLEAKFKFLPPGVEKGLRRRLSLDDDFQRAQQHQTIPPNLLEPSQVSAQRANVFFRTHKYFQNALGTQAEIKDAENYLEIQFVRKVLAPLLNDKGLQAVHPQHQIGPYQVDFAIQGKSSFVFEVDGFAKFKERRALDDFINRQNYITSRGWRVIRFTFSQIVESTELTLKTLHTLLKDDSAFRGFLTVQWHTGAMRSLFRRTEGPQVMDIVNDFYRVQDRFVETALCAQSANATIQIDDGFELQVPFVALAVSSLFEFLDAVQSVVDVDFQLPNVLVGGSRAEGWESELHSRVSVSSAQTQGAVRFEALSVRFKPAAIPAPTLAGEEIRFRTGLNLDDIRQRLEYFTHKVFGYSTGTKPFQDRVLQRVLEGQHVLGISATGSGKSFCFWLPALLKPGLTLIICPLRSLMRDQRLTLRNYGIASAEFINSDVDKLTQRRILEEAKLGYVRLLYISPERLRIKKFLAELEQLQLMVPVNFLAVDEAHCISEWGHDFRPSYLKLPFLREKISAGNARLQLIALTATAGQQVEQDMLGILKLRGGDEGHVVRERVADREKFSYQIVPVSTSSSKTKTYHDIITKYVPKALGRPSLPDLLRLSNQRREKAMGIVFCIYADPHGQSSIWDGTAHYLYETMGVLEPQARWDVDGSQGKKWLMQAYSTGRVRAFSSKPPTLCPKCSSYAYTTKPSSSRDSEEEEEEGDDEEKLTGKATGIKVCFHCRHEFEAPDALVPPKWQELVKSNQSEFKDSLFDILVATKGFGMGIDKSSVRFIVHTSLSSGLESWYQEVGRAGRDNERAHIVLLVDPPNEACRRELGGLEVKRPRCSYRGGCPHAKDSLCDYGKQHMFVTSSYPGAESDAVSALRVLDKLIGAREESADGSVVLSSSNKYLSHTELAVYRLTVLGLVEDYVITYRPNPRFDVEFLLPESPGTPSSISRIQQRMQSRLAEHLSHFSSRRGRSIERELELRIKEYEPLERFSAKTRAFATIEKYEELFAVVYQHLLLLLDHTYKDVVKMRYDMLWNLQTLVTSKKCRRLQILPHFGDSLEESYRCGCCDVCSPALEFPESRIAPQARSSTAEKELELERALSEDGFDRVKLGKLKNEFLDYPTAKYRQARSVLEGDANNLTALFLAREFSPPEEYLGNAKRLLRTANQKSLPLPEIAELFKSSKTIKADLLTTLNEADTSCDCALGWKFLRDEAARPEQHRKAEVAAMRECLDFMLFVDSTLSEAAELLKGKARELEKVLYA
jgi:superfamily II DNA helicase RecQ/very-short-patch-repair endonuclease